MTKTDELHVVFGTGPLGMAVMQELLSRGKTVRVVNRSGQANVPKEVEFVKGDATDHVSVRNACKGATVIYNCTKAPYTEWPEKFPPIMDGIIEGAAHANAKIVYGDNLYMYGPTSKQLTEDLPNSSTGRKGRTRAKMATTLLEAHKSGKVQATIGRGPDFFGPGVLDSALGERVFGAALANKPAEVLGNIDVPHTYIFIRDFAKGLVTLGQHEEALGQVWHIPSSETLTTRQIIQMIYQELGKEAKFRIAPKPFVSFLALFNSTMKELKEMLYQFEQPFVVDHEKYLRVFNSDTTPHQEAIRETMDWFKQKMNR